MKKFFKLLFVAGIIAGVVYLVKRKLDADREWAEAIDRELAATDDLTPSTNGVARKGEAAWSAADSTES
ncbi:MAG: hypothetical protein ACOYNI_12585 [Acidimicrobiia bacterium]